MNALVFVDTNIFVYARDARESSKRELATQWIARLWQEQTGRTSAQVLSEYYVTLTRKLKPGIGQDDAWDDVQSLMAWDPQQIDRELLSLAREVERRYRLSWWDSMIVAAAQLQGCTVLLSEDLQSGMAFDRVVVRNPFIVRVEDAQEAYLVPMKARPRHRSRGRPTRKVSSSV
jgi:predicted nucleic acid-binding protein